MASNDQVLEPPTDTISSLAFSPSSSHLLVSSWDGSLQLHNFASSQALTPTKFQHPAAVLTSCFSTDSTAFSGGLDRKVRSWDIETQTPTLLGEHQDTVKSLVYSPEIKSIFSGSWDSTLLSFDPLSSSSSGPTSTTTLPSRVYAMATSGNRLVVAMSERNVHVYDVRNMKEPEQRRESALKYMTRDISCMSDGKGWASCSIEGRIAVDYFDPEDQAKKYAYRCHRGVVDGQDIVYPINALAYNPVTNTFASAGSDSTLSLWDHHAKKRMKQYPKFPNSLSALAFSPDGRHLAIAYGYGWDEGALPEVGPDGRLADAKKGEVGLVIKGGMAEDCKPKPAGSK